MTIEINAIAALILVSPLLLWAVFLIYRHWNQIYKIRRKYQKEVDQLEHVLLDYHGLASTMIIYYLDDRRDTELYKDIQKAYELGPTEEGGFGGKNSLPLGFSKGDIGYDEVDREKFYETQHLVELEGAQEKSKPYWEEEMFGPPFY